MGMNPRLLRPTASGFDPRRIADLGAWWDAAKGVGAGNGQMSLNGTGVELWRDASGNNRDLEQTTAGVQPDFTAAAQNELPAVTFAQNDLLQTVNNFHLTGNASFTVFCAYKKTTSNQGAVYGWGTLSSLGAFGLYDAGTAEYPFAGAGNNFPVTAVPNNTFGVMTFVKPAGAISGASSFRNGTSNATGTPSGNTPNLSSNKMSIGRWATFTGVTFAGVFAEMLVYNRDLATSERQRVERYLGAKWGITVA